MRMVFQRVESASVEIVENGARRECAKIGAGALVLVAVENGDTSEDTQWLAAKAANMRVFEDADGKMNVSLKDGGGDLIVVSQFTLFGNMRKGSRPSFNRSAHPETAVPLYEEFCAFAEAELGKKIGRGEFGADMRVHLVNDGPVTIIADSRNRDI
mgnify:FL=1